MTLPDDFLDQLKAVYPKREGGQGWADVKKQVAKRIAEGYTFERILQGAKNYAVHCGRKQMSGTEYVQQCATFVGPGLWFDEYADMDLRTPAQRQLDADWAELESRAKAMGFQTVDRSKGLTVARYAIEQAERQPLRVVK